MNNQVLQQLVNTAAKAGVFLYVEHKKLCFDLSVDTFPEALKAEILANKTDLIDFLQPVGLEHLIEEIDVRPEPTKDSELSSGQHRFWLLDQLEGGSSHYHLVNGLMLEGTLSLAAMQYAFDRIIARHQILRTVYIQNEQGQPVQQIKTIETLPIKQQCLPSMGGSLEQIVQTIVTEETHQPFDLSKELMLRVTLININSHRHVVLLCLHHIAADGWSMGILVDEFSELYTAFLEQRSPELNDLPIQYADYAYWQQQVGQEEIHSQLEYWQEQLAELPHLHQLPTSHPRPAEQDFNGAIFSHTIDSPTYQQLLTLCHEQQVTLFMALHALMGSVIGFYSNQTDIALGTFVANRDQLEVAPLVGLFVNTLVLRNDLSGNPTFLTLLERSKHELLGAYIHQQVPFEQVVEALNPERSASFNPLFQVALVLQNNESKTLHLPELTLSSLEFSDDQAKFDLCLEVQENIDGLVLNWEYATALFEPERIEEMAMTLARLLSFFLQNPSQRLASAPMLSEQDKNKQLKIWNHTDTPYPKTKTLHHLFEEKVIQQPECVAITSIHGGLSYQEVNEQANQLARYLGAHTEIRQESRVGLCLPRSADAVIAILAILKMGACYVPIDPANPPIRIQQLIEQSELQGLITIQPLQALIPQHQVGLVYLDVPTVQANLQTYSTANLSLNSQHATDLAYIIYTSGSTGQPKGVMVEHRNVVSLVIQPNYAEFSAQTVMLFNAPISFDAATLEIWAPLLHGGQLVIQPETMLGVQDLGRFIQQWEINTAWLTAGLFDAFVAGYTDILPTLRQLLVGGDVVNPLTIKALYQRQPELEVINGYGPTENTTFSTCYPIGRGEVFTQNIPIGQPLQNRQVYILNTEKKLLPIGSQGELYVGGAGVARGYYNQPELSAEYFIHHPYAVTSEGGLPQLYRTGDIAYWGKDGTLHYVGRQDQQIKVRGFRIELGEIEAAMLQVPFLDEAVVIYQSETDKPECLIGYYCSHTTLSVTTVREALTAQLPSYMIPTFLQQLDRFPLGVNGKINRHALPAPEISRMYEVDLPPQSATEITLSGLWQSLLGINAIGRKDNFFSLGGHSLLLTRLNSLISTTFSVQISLRDLFLQPILADMGRLIDITEQTNMTVIAPMPESARRVLSFAQYRLWLTAQIHHESSEYNIVAPLKLTGKLNQDALVFAFTALIERHHILRSVYQTGENGEPEQILQPTSFTLVEVDLTELDLLAQQKQQTQLATLEAEKPFMLSTDQMIRATLITLNTTEFVLLITLHHIAADGWSMNILINEFSELYQSVVNQHPVELVPLSLHYADYAYWQQQHFTAATLAADFEYWQEHLANLPKHHYLPLDQPRPLIPTFVGKNIDAIINSRIRVKLMTLCEQQGATLFMGLQAAFAVLLARYSQTTDIVMGTVIADREQAEVAHLIGFFTNTLVLRSDLSANPHFIDLLAQSKNRLLAAYHHQHTPFEQLVEKLAPEHSRHYNPLFQILLVMQNNEIADINLPDLHVSLLESEENQAKFDLKLTVVDDAEQGLILTWNYDCALFEHQRINALAEHFVHLLTQLVDHPKNTVFSIPMLTKEEQQQQLSAYPLTLPEPLIAPNLAALFEQQVQTTPQQIAITAESQQLSYEDLNIQANQLAHYLQQHYSISPETVIGVSTVQSITTVVAIMALLKVGAAYVPLPVDYPHPRLMHMIKDSRLTVIISDDLGLSILQNLILDSLVLINLDSTSLQQQLSTLSRNNLELTIDAKQLAYIIYTSGSTGTPKGVLVEQQGAIYLAQQLQQEIIQPSVSKRWGWMVSYAFDGSVKGLLALFTGTTLVVVPPSLKTSPTALLSYLQQQQVDIVDGTPSVVSLLLSDPQTQQTMGQFHWALGGEAINSTLWTTLAQTVSAQGKQAFNLYGPTEATVNATWTVIEEQVNPHIGRPLASVELVLLQAGKLVPFGARGEICLGGPGIARGYLNQPALTAEQFIDNPYYGQGLHSPRLYRTGDNACWQSDGTLRYLGRDDQQVKIRGYRIELGEIEAALLAETEIDAATVVCRQDQTEAMQLVAYYTSATSLAASELQTQLAKKLPLFMIPNKLIMINALPLTKNGKVDHHALAQINLSSTSLHYVPPQTVIEKQLCELWGRLLKVDRVGITDNFFLLGGHSLLAARLKIDLFTTFAVDITLQEIFEALTIERLAPKIIALQTTASLVQPEHENWEDREW